MAETKELGKEATESTSKTSGPGSDAGNMGIKTPTAHPGAGIGNVPNDWNDAVASDGSPVKTALRPPEGHVPYSVKPKTVAEHNAYVDKKSRDRFPVRG